MKTKVCIVKCKTYDFAEVNESVKKAFDFLGGLSSFIGKDEKVLIKPNMLSGKTAEYGVNSHIEVVRAIIRQVKECGAFPAIGDNPGGSDSPSKIYASSGFLTVAREENVECIESKSVKMIKDIPVSSYFLEYDKIISVPKMKTHSLMGLTGAVKNMYGAVSGLAKSEWHKKRPSPGEFSDLLIEIYGMVRPDLVLMDGVVAMEGDGPASGELKPAGILICGSDSVSIDAVFSYLTGMDPMSLLTTKKAHEKGLGQGDINEIEFPGEKPEDVKFKKFKMPRSAVVMNLPKPVVKIAAKFIKFGPHINPILCRECMLCAKSCPVRAITIDSNRKKIDHSKCIRCMCCHELCPHGAISLKRNFLAKGFGL